MFERFKRNDSTANTQNNEPARTPIKVRIDRFFQGLFGRKPAYRITKHGVEIEYFDFSDTDNLPFDLETYQDTQIFIQDYANPWYFDLDSIEENYPNFTEEEVTKVSDVFAEKHVYPSQRWKLLANQNVLRDMFVGGAFNDQRIMRLLYLIGGGVGLLLLIILGGGI